MKTLLLVLFLSFSLYAKNPVIFAALGDVIYNDVPKFEQLGDLASMQDLKPMIEQYIKAADESKKRGFAVDRNATSNNPKAYLKGLRQLSTQHDAIVTQANKRFDEAIKDEEPETITDMIKIGVVDPEVYKSRLIQYYEENAEDQNLSVLEPMYREYTLELEREHNASKAVNPDVLKNEELLKRVRVKEKSKNEALARSVKEESEREKKKVMNEQKKELGIE